MRAGVRQLRQAGYALATVPHWEWAARPDRPAREAYLRALLAAAAADKPAATAASAAAEAAAEAAGEAAKEEPRADSEVRPSSG